MKSMEKVVVMFLAIILTAATMSACGGGTGASVPRFSDDVTEIVSFTFPDALNTSLSSDVYATIDGDNITATVPAGTDLTGLVAEYVTDSNSVDAAGVTLESGITSVNYSSPVQYTVSGNEGKQRVYTVSVTAAPSGEKYMAAFSIDNIQGEINGENGSIAVEMPYNTDVKSLAPSFQAVCDSVSANGTVQKSGESTNDFTSPVVYTLTAEDGSKKDYTVTVSVQPDTSKEITSFSFQADDNSSLSGNAEGVIDGNRIEVVLPSGTDSAALVATTETTGGTVTVDNKTLENGETANDYTESVDLVVTAQDGTSRIYTVDVVEAEKDEKAITSFTVNDEQAVVDETAGTITVTVAPGEKLNETIPEFVTTGETVKVNGVEQSSGETVANLDEAGRYDVTAADGSTKTYNVVVKEDPDILVELGFNAEGESGYTVHGADYVAGLQGDALYFNNDDYLLVPDSQALTLANAGTIETVIKASSEQPFAGIVHKGVSKDFDDEAYSLQYRGSDGRLRLILTGDSGKTVHADSRTRIDTGSWYHIVATWDENNVSLYVNGNLERSVENTAGPLMDSDGALVIGAQLADEDFNRVWDNLGFNGAIDSVRILGRVMTSDEVEARYDSLPSDKSGALTAFLLASAYRNSQLIGIILGVFLLMLAVVYGINLYRAKHQV